MEVHHSLFMCTHNANYTTKSFPLMNAIVFVVPFMSNSVDTEIGRIDTKIASSMLDFELGRIRLVTLRNIIDCTDRLFLPTSVDIKTP